MENKTALLIMDMQPAMLQTFGNAADTLQQAAKAIAAARAKNIPVIYVVLGFRKDTPEINQHNKTFFQMKAMFGADNFSAIDPAVAPLEHEVVVTKRRYSAFTGSDLEVVLRGQETRHLVLSGFTTSGVVLSTLREAADKDFQLTVLSDACADRDPEVHNVLMTKIFPRQAEVVTVDEWITSMRV